MDLTNTLMYAAGKRGLDNIKTVGSYVGRNAESFLGDMPIAKAIGGVISNPTSQEVGAQISNLGGAISDSLQESTKDPMSAILNFSPMGAGTIVGKGVKRLQVLHTNIPEDLMPVIERKKGKIIENPNKGWMKESHIEVDENGKEILPINNKKDIGFVGRFYRSGSIPDSGKSINYQNGNILDGVSVYPLPEPESFAGLQGRDWYTGKGKVVGYGPDGEPLIRPIGEWEKFSKSKSSDRYRDLNIFLDKKRIEYMSKNKISAEDFLDK